MAPFFKEDSNNARGTIKDGIKCRGFIPYINSNMAEAETIVREVYLGISGWNY